MLPRLYSPEALQNKTACELGADNLRYLKTVLRLKPGDAIRVFDGFGHEFEAQIECFGPGNVKVRLEEPLPTLPKNIHITLAQAMPKAGKMDGIVKTAAELATDVIIPFTAARSVGRVEKEKALFKATRWQKIVREAARCSRSPLTALIEPVMSFAQMLDRATPDMRKMIFWEEEDQVNIRQAINDAAFADIRRFFIIVGPEGGLTREEIDCALRAGFVSVSLGRQILKVETAAAAILSILQYEKGIFSQ